MAFKKNNVKINLGSYPHYFIMGLPKVGKTTLMYELAKKEYSLDEMILISCGNEQGFHALDGIQYEEVLKFNKKEDSNGERGFVQVVDDIVKHYKEYGIKMVVIDTLDTLYDIGTEQVIKEHLQQTGKPCKSLNDCFGGFQRGRDRLIEIVTNEIHKLDRLPIAVFILGHTKFKSKKDILTGEEYEQLTNNLRTDFFAPISNSAQMIVNVAIERDIEEGIQTGETRYMYFQNNGLIDCGGRFTGLPEKLELSAENFMEAFKIGVQNSMGEKTESEISKMRREEELENERKAEEVVKELEKAEIEEDKEAMKELINQLKDKSKDSKNKQILMKCIKESGKSKVSDLTLDEIKDILDKLN